MKVKKNDSDPSPVAKFREHGDPSSSITEDLPSRGLDSWRPSSSQSSTPIIFKSSAFQYHMQLGQNYM